jgi:hypothetical protein
MCFGWLFFKTIAYLSPPTGWLATQVRDGGEAGPPICF